MTKCMNVTKNEHLLIFAKCTALLFSLSLPSVFNLKKKCSLSGQKPIFSNIVKISEVLQYFQYFKHISIFSNIFKISQALQYFHYFQYLKHVFSNIVKISEALQAAESPCHFLPPMVWSAPALNIQCILYIPRKPSSENCGYFFCTIIGAKFDNKNV